MSTAATAFPTSPTTLDAPNRATLAEAVASLVAAPSAATANATAPTRPDERPDIAAPLDANVVALAGQVAGRLDGASRIAVGGLLLHGDLRRPLDSRLAAVIRRTRIRGLGRELAASFCLEAIEALREQVQEAERERRVASAPLRALVARALDAVDSGVDAATMTDALGLTAESWRRSLGLTLSPQSGGLPETRRFSLPLRLAEEIAETIGVAGWRVELLSNEFLSTWTPPAWAVDVVRQFGWLSEAGPSTSERAWCSRVLRELGMDQHEQDQVVTWARRKDGLSEFDFTPARLAKQRDRLARWEAAAERDVPAELRRQQLGATRTVVREGTLWLIARRLVSGWVLERVVGGSEERTEAVADFAAHEPFLSVQVVAIEVAAGV